MLKERIDKELKEAMKAKDQVKVSALRMLKSEMQKVAIEKREELKDDAITKVIQKSVKQRKESIEQFEKGNRADLAEKEKKELAVLESFLPEMISEDKLKEIVTAVISELGASTKKDMGRVMKEVLARAKGAADGKMVSQIVSGLLS